MADLLFEHDRCQVWHGNWQDIGFPADFFTKILSDPPYTEHVHANVRSCNTTGPIKVETYDIPFAAVSGSDVHTYVPKLLEICSSWTVLFCALEQLGVYADAAGGPRARLESETAAQYRARLAAHVRSGIWRKQQAAPQLTGDRPANSCEGFSVLHRRGGKLAWNGRGKHAYLSSHEEDADAPFGVPDFVDEGRERAKKRHAAQKPAGLCKRLAEWFVNPGDVVGDLWAGSGNLGFAALKRGATVVLVDSDPEWAVFCAERAAEMTAALAK